MKIKFLLTLVCLLAVNISVFAKIRNSSPETSLSNQNKQFGETAEVNNYNPNHFSSVNCNNSPFLFAPQAACNGFSITAVNFNNASRTVASGTTNTVGVVYRYTNVGTAPDGTVLDALVTVTNYSNNQDTNQTNFSDADVPQATAGFDGNLQPNINQESVTFAANGMWNGSITYHIQFVVTGTSTPKVINVAATTIDNDGGAVCASTLRESVTYSSALNQVLTSTTSNQTIAGNTITGPTTNQANIGIGGDFANAALYVNVSELNWTYSFATVAGTNCTAGAASAARYGSLNMSCQISFDRQFSSITLSGTVFNDGNGLTDSTVNGTGTGTPSGTQLYANLVDTNGNVVSSVTVAANGTYTFSSVVTGSYTVRISSAQGVESNAAPSNNLPTNWVFTGENLGAGSGNDGTINGSLPVTVSSTSITNANIGIERRPTAGTNTLSSQANPPGLTFVTIPSTAFSGADADAGSSITSIRITQFPTNATSIRINGIPYTSLNFPGGGVSIPTNASGQPTQTVEIDPIDGTVSSVINYRTTDNAGFESTADGTVTAPFTAPTAASGDISGKLMTNGNAVANALVVLVNLENSQKKVARTNANGEYLFEGNAVGNNYVVRPVSNKYQFAPATKFISLTENANNEDFAAANKPYRAKNDFDGDGISDIVVYRASEGNWYVLKSIDGEMASFKFGLSDDKPVSGDFDGDGMADYAVFRATEGNWYIWESGAQKLRVENFGLANDKLVAADYDADGKTDIAVYRNGVWYVRKSSDNTLEVHNFGLESDIPAVKDFDGDNKADVAVYRAADKNWYIKYSSDNSFHAVNFGLETDMPVAADFDGDGQADIAQFRNGKWFIQNSTTDFEANDFGTEGDITVDGDFDGDGRTDLTVFRDGIWYVKKSFSGNVNYIGFGLKSDIVVK